MNDMVTIPRAEYDRLMAVQEDFADMQSLARFDRAMSEGREELLPSDFVDRALAGESLLHLFRELRGLTQVGLAQASGVNRVQIADIEAKRGTGSVATLIKLAGALGVSIDDLV